MGFGAEKGERILLEMMKDYESLTFLHDDGSVNYTTCTKINTHVLVEHGLQQNNKKQVIDEGILILPTEYLCPINYETDMLHKTPRTIAIHWFAKSWMTKESILRHEKRRKEIILDWWIHLPNRVLIMLLGPRRYERIKCLLKKRKA